MRLLAQHTRYSGLRMLCATKHRWPRSHGAFGDRSSAKGTRTLDFPFTNETDAWVHLPMLNGAPRRRYDTLTFAVVRFTPAQVWASCEACHDPGPEGDEGPCPCCHAALHHCTHCGSVGWTMDWASSPTRGAHPSYPRCPALLPQVPSPPTLGTHPSYPECPPLLP